MMHAKETSKTEALRFPQSKGAEKLKSLAQTPFDLSKEGNLTPSRLKEFVGGACGYKLLYGTERVDLETMKTLFELASEMKVIEKMHNMQAGEIINCIYGFPSEERPALHTATRDFFDAPMETDAAKKATALARKEVEKLRIFMDKIDAEDPFSDMIVIGIGGSELGPKAMYEALLPLSKPGRRVHFLGNIDPDGANGILRNVDLKRSAVVVISKTGSTLETVTNEAIFRDSFAASGLQSEKHFIAITGANSPLDNRERYLEVFNIWDWVGGRYCSTAMPGGVLLSFAYGFPVFWEFLKGAHAMDKAALQNNTTANLPLLAALLGIWNRNFLNCPNVAIIPYSQALARFPSHIQQLDMESNGKQIDKWGRRVAFETGPIIFGEPGTNAQHSFFQLIHQGTTIFPTEMIGFKSAQTKAEHEVQGTTSQQKLLSNMFAQSIALATGERNENPNKNFPGNRPNSILLGKELTPFALGALLAFYEHKVAFQGFIWEINSFDQMGVELGKRLAVRQLKLFADPEYDYPLGKALLQQLETL